MTLKQLMNKYPIGTAVAFNRYACVENA